MNNNKKKASPLLYAAIGIGLAYAVRKARRMLSAANFQGKTVLITGGARGLGLAIGLELAARGANLVICSRNKNQLWNAQQRLEKAGAGVLAVQADLSIESDAGSMVEQAVSRFGSIDLLINNAGVMTVGPQDTMFTSDYIEVMGANTWSALHCIKAVIPYFKSLGSGHIVNITSVGGQIAVPHMLPYSVSKFALYGLSVGLGAELARDGIGVTTVVPGLMRTGSPRNIEVRGDHQAEYAWFKIAGSMPVLSIDAQSAASRIIEGVAAGEKLIILTLPAKVAVVMQGLFPELITGAFRLINRMLPSGKETTIRKGHESESAITLKGIARKSDEDAVKYNQL